MGSDTNDVLLALRTEWRLAGRGTAARRALDALRADVDGHVVPHWVLDLSGLTAALEPSGGLDRLHRARVVALLLARAEDDMVRRCLLQTMLPGIVSVARQLRFGDGIADGPRSFLADALSEAVELFDDWAGQRRAYAAPDLLSALRCRLRRRLLADKARRAELRDAPERAGDAIDDALSRTIALDAADGVTDVDLLYARCVLGHTAGELADALGVTYGVLHRRLAAAALHYDVAPT